MPVAVQAFLDAADDLLAAQQQVMTQPVSVELRALTEAYVALRLVVLDGRVAASAAGTTRAPEPRAAPTSP
jgi:hypothetical protein